MCDYWGTLSGRNPVRGKSLDVSVSVVLSVAASRAVMSVAAENLEGNLLAL